MCGYCCGQVHFVAISLALDEEPCLLQELCLCFVRQMVFLPFFVVFVCGKDTSVFICSLLQAQN